MASTLLPGVGAGGWPLVPVARSGSTPSDLVELGAQRGELRFVVSVLAGAEVVAEAEEEQGEGEGENDRDRATGSHGTYSKFGNRNRSPSCGQHPALRTPQVCLFRLETDGGKDLPSASYWDVRSVEAGPGTVKLNHIRVTKFCG